MLPAQRPRGSKTSLVFSVLLPQDGTTIFSAQVAAMFLSQGVTAFHISLLQPQGAGAPAAVLVHAAVSDTQQQVLYGALCDAAQESHEWQALNTCI